MSGQFLWRELFDMIKKEQIRYLREDFRLDLKNTTGTLPKEQVANSWFIPKKTSLLLNAGGSKVEIPEDHCYIVSSPFEIDTELWCTGELVVL